MTTTVNWTPYGGTSPYQLSPKSSVNNGVGTVIRDIVDLGKRISFGGVEWVSFMDEKPLFSGRLYRGGVFGGREGILLPLFCQCQNEATAKAEQRFLDRLFSPYLGPGLLEVTTENGLVSAECIKVEWQALQYGHDQPEGLFGAPASGSLEYPLVFMAPDPWWLTALLEYFSGEWATNTTQTLNNPSVSEAGLHLVLTAKGDSDGESASTAIALTNETTGKVFTIGGVALETDDQVIIDWYGSHDEALRVYHLRASDSAEFDLMNVVGVSSRAILIPGENVLRLVYSGMSAGFTALLKIRERYLSP